MEANETKTFDVHYEVGSGIEHVTYIPRQRRFEAPIIMQHGMLHGAWWWQHWQELFAEWGWESHAFSLPGQAGSPEQRPISLCTLDYYLRFLKAERKSAAYYRADFFIVPDAAHNIMMEYNYRETAEMIRN